MANDKVSGTFELPTKTVVLKFVGDYEGAEAEVLVTVSIERLFDFIGMVEGDDARAVFEPFGREILKSWNVTKGGKALPATGKGMLQADPVFGALVVMEWAKAVSDPPAPLYGKSSNGRNEEMENLIPTQPLSEPMPTHLPESTHEQSS